MPTPTTSDAFALFAEINKDEADFVPFSDIEYYTEQIQNIYSISKKNAKTLATEIYKISLHA